MHALLHQRLILPSNHIYHENTELLVRENPEILELGLINFSFDPQYENFKEYFSDQNREKKAGRPLDNYGEFLDSISIKKSEYSSSTPAKFFTELTYEQLSNSHTALVKASRISDSTRLLMLEKLKEQAERSNGVVFFPEFLKQIQFLRDPLSIEVFQNYGDLARLMAGAASKNCANMIPQENLIDWCIVNPADSKENIASDEVIFWQVIMENLLAATNGLANLQDFQQFNENTLDRLTFEDVNDLRNLEAFSEFNQQYELIVNQSATAHKVGAGELGLVNFEELISIKDNIQKKYNDVIESEVSLHSGIRMIETLLRIPFQLYGGAIQAMDSLVTYSVLKNANDHSWRKFVDSKVQRVECAKRYALKHCAGQPVLIEFLTEIIERAKRNWSM